MRDSIRIADDYLAEVLAGRERLLLDGAMGTMMQRDELIAPGQLPDLLCLENPQAVTAIHRAYVEAGSQAVTTNTFGSSRLKLGSSERVSQVYEAAVACARESGARYVAADIGPTGELLDPYGDLEFDEAVELFAEQARAAQAAGADIVIIETMADVNEACAAATAAVQSCSLPVFATMTFTAHGCTIMGNSPEDAAGELEAAGVDALGLNCSLGPADLKPLACSMLQVAKVPVIVQANAGLPTLVDGQAVYSIGPGEYAAAVSEILDAGASIVGGCCGTDPDFISALAEVLELSGHA